MYRLIRYRIGNRDDAHHGALRRLFCVSQNNIPKYWHRLLPKLHLISPYRLASVSRSRQMIFPGRRSPVGDSLIYGRLTFSEAQAAKNSALSGKKTKRIFLVNGIDTLC